MKIALAQMKMTPEMEINYQKSISLMKKYFNPPSEIGDQAKP